MNLVHGGDLTSYYEQFPGKTALDFSANINPLGMPDGVAAALRECAEPSTHYPDPLCRELTAAIAGYEDVPNEWILCGNGASDLIWRIAWAEQPARALLPAPTFLDYQKALEAVGCVVRHHQLPAESFAVDEGFLCGIDNDTWMVFLCNPNNPTGQLTEPPILTQILRRCREVDATLVVDECFLDFVPDGEAYSLKPYLAEYDNLIILKAFTKIIAMPGVRLGYLLTADRKRLEKLARTGPTWSVSVPAQRCGVAAVTETEYLARTRKLVPTWRDELASGLATLGLEVYPGAANYLFFSAQTGLAEALKPHGILIRDCANYVGLEPGHYRVAVRKPEDNRVLLKKLEVVL